MEQDSAEYQLDEAKLQFELERPKKRRDQYAGQFKVGTVIGKGGFGTVYKGLDLNTGTMVALKGFHASKISKKNLADIMRETEVLKRLTHPNIVEFYGYIKTADMLYFVMEYVEEGAFTSVLKDFETIPEKLAAVYIKQVLEGLSYLHNEGVIHRDLKGSNILLTKAGNVKLADFGVSAIINENEKRFSVVGTPYWMAPEVIEISGHSFKSDVWSVGCLICELISGKPPYYDLAPMTAIFHIVHNKHPPLPEDTSELLQDFLEKCWTKEPADRPSVDELLQHIWITSDKTETYDVMKPKSFDVKLLLADEPSNMSPRSLQQWRVSSQEQPSEHNGGTKQPEKETKSGAEGEPAVSPRREAEIQPQQQGKAGEEGREKKKPGGRRKTEGDEQKTQPKDGGDDEEKCATIEIRTVGGANDGGAEGDERDERPKKKNKKQKKRNLREETVHISLKTLRLKKDHEDPEVVKKKQEEKLSKLMDQLESEAQRPRCKHGLNCKSTDATHFLKFVHTPENPELSKTEQTREDVLWEKLDYCQKENARLSSQIISLEQDNEKIEGQRDHYVLQLAERSARDDEIIALANAALAACITEDDANEPPANESNEEENEEYEARLYKHEIKRRLEKLIEERKAASLLETKEMLISMASLGKNVKEKKKEVKRMIKDRKREEKKYKEGIEKLKKKAKGRRGSSTISLAHTFHLKGSRVSNESISMVHRRHSALPPVSPVADVLATAGTAIVRSAPPSTTASPVSPSTSPPLVLPGSTQPERRRTDKL